MTDKFTGGGLDSLTKVAYETGYEDGAAAEREALLSAVDEIERENRQFPVSCDVFRSAIRARGEK